MKKRIAILTGGTSSEREVAFWSAKMVEETLRDQFDLTVFDFPSEIDAFLSSRTLFDVVIPVFHGPMGEDGTIQGFLRTLGVPFIFSDVEAHAIGMNKRLAKLAAADAGLNVTDDYCISRGDKGRFEFACVVKPLAGGSTIGVSIVKSENEFDQALQKSFQYADEVLVERFIEGREFTVAVIDEGGKAFALPVIEIVSNDGFFDFDKKYTDGKMAKEICPAEIPNDLTQRLQDHALKIHNSIGARHVSRTDFIVDQSGTPWFLEINTIPGLTKNSLVPKAIRASGRDVAEVFKEWIDSVK